MKIGGYRQIGMLDFGRKMGCKAIGDKENQALNSPSAHMPAQAFTPPLRNFARPRPFTAPTASSRRPVLEERGGRVLWSEEEDTAGGFMTEDDDEFLSSIRCIRSLSKHINPHPLAHALIHFALHHMRQVKMVNRDITARSISLFQQGSCYSCSD